MSGKNTPLRFVMKEVFCMKTRAFLDAINNGYARMLIGEDEREQMNFLLAVLNEYIESPLKEGDILELTLSEQREVVNARKLVKETEKRWRQGKALNDWLMYGIYSDELKELDKKGV